MSPLAQAPVVARVFVGDAVFGVRTLGSGPPLLLLTGFRGVMAGWDPLFLEALAADGRRVLALDNRGMGTSASPVDVSVSVASMALDAEAVLDALGVEETDVLGWGLGGAVAQELALAHPERVRALVLVGSDHGGEDLAPPAPEVEALLAHDHLREDERLRAHFPWTAEGREAASASYERVASLPWAGTEAFTLPSSFVAKQRHAGGPAWYGPGCGTRDRLDGVGCPTLVLGGLEDRVSPAQNSHTLACAIPGARLHLYPAMGHDVVSHHPRMVAEDVLGFLHDDVPEP